MTYIASVGIARGRADPSIVLNVLEGIIHETSIATSIAVFPGTVDQLLLTQTH